MNLNYSDLCDDDDNDDDGITNSRSHKSLFMFCTPAITPSITFSIMKILLPLLSFSTVHYIYAHKNLV